MSTIKYTYTYKEYENFPRASVVSHTLASIGFYVGLFSFYGIILCALLLCLSKSVLEFIAGIALILALIALRVFMRKVYPKIADRIIQKIIEDTIQRRSQSKA